MKAYQLKITIKNAKPPIWRRCIVPAGITFSQLSIILNKVMGWSGYHLSEYEFYYLGLQLREEDKFDDFEPFGDFDLLDSSKTYIDEYMEKQEWFTYTYDFGDDWQHRVTIEQVLTDYLFNYPQVVKFKGDCPMEDCGGIDGYYECLDILEDENHPEHEERREWAESQGYGYSYDMDEVNKDLCETCFVTYGKGETRIQEEIYEDMFSGKYGLNGSKTARNKEKPIKSKHSHDDYMANREGFNFIEQLVAENQELQRKLKQIAKTYDPSAPDATVPLIKDALLSAVDKYIKNKLPKDDIVKSIRLGHILGSYTKEELKDIAKIHNLRKVSTLNKAELIKAIEDRMLLPVTVRDSFIVLNDDEIQAFESAAEHSFNYYVNEDKGYLFNRLLFMGYIGRREDDKLDVPRDVIEAYRMISTKEFHILRKRVSWLISCFHIAEFLYGAVPVNIMVRIFNRRKGLKTDKQTLLADYNEIPQNKREFFLIEDLFIHRSLFPKEYQSLMRLQGNKGYYIPTIEEIEDYEKYHYLPNDQGIIQLVHYFTEHLAIEETHAAMAANLIQHKINQDCTFQDIFDLLNRIEIVFQSEENLKEFVPILNNVWNNTRVRLNRGYKPEELFQEERKHLRPLGPGNMPTIVPGSSSAAKMLKENREVIEGMGFPIDLESNATEIPVYTMPGGSNGSVEMKTRKVYPNDPCPCGSGKKYKKCCGR